MKTSHSYCTVMLFRKLTRFMIEIWPEEWSKFSTIVHLESKIENVVHRLLLKTHLHCPYVNVKTCIFYKSMNYFAIRIIQYTNIYFFEKWLITFFHFFTVRKWSLGKKNNSKFSSQFLLVLDKQFHWICWTLGEI